MRTSPKAAWSVIAVATATLLAIGTPAMASAQGPVLAETAAVQGTVRTPDGSTLPGTVRVSVIAAAGYEPGALRGDLLAGPADGGVFGLTNIPPGTYTVSYRLYEITDPAGTSLMGGLYPGTFDTTSATRFVLGSGDVVTLDIVLSEGISITGSITSERGGELPASTTVQIFDSSGARPARTVPISIDRGAGTYRIGPILPGRYKVGVIVETFEGFVRSTYSGGSPTLEGAVAIDVRTDTVADIELAAVSGIQGTLTALGPPRTLDTLESQVWAVIRSTAPDGPRYHAGVNRITGVYSATNVAPGEYTVGFTTAAMFPPIGSTEWYYGNDLGCWEDEFGSSTLSIGERELVSGIDGDYPTPGLVTMSFIAGAGAEAGLVVPTDVLILKWDETAGDYIDFLTLTEVTSVSMPLPAGRYALRFVSPRYPYGGVLLNSEWWENSRYFAGGTDIVVEPGIDQDLGVIELSGRELDLGRVAGADRFATSVEANRLLVPTVPAAGVPVLYLANGLDFPDALSAGPVASAAGGALLLTAPDQIPSSVVARIRELKPQRIVLVGGAPSISPAVLAQLQALDLPGDPSITRVAGSDRFDTSRRLIESVFAEGSVKQIFIATGNNYPDALAAGGTASSLGIPVLLVNGQADRLDDATLALIRQLGVEDAWILGGIPSVSDGIHVELEGLLAGEAIRIGGPDRFSTAAMINAEFVEWSDYAFVTNGLNFPDALAIGPTAAAFGAPVYLATPGCMPPVSADGILFGADAQALVAVGGQPSISDASLTMQSIC